MKIIVHNYHPFRRFLIYRRPNIITVFNSRRVVSCVEIANMPVPLAVQSMAYVWGRSLGGIWIQPGAWMFFCCECCVLSGSGLCDQLIIHPEDSYRLWCVVVCDLETLRLKNPRPRWVATPQKTKNIAIMFVCFWHNSPQWARVSSFTRFLDHTQPLTTVGRTLLDAWSACRREFYLTVHNTYNRQTSMSRVEIEPTISAGERP